MSGCPANRRQGSNIGSMFAHLCDAGPALIQVNNVSDVKIRHPQYILHYQYNQLLVRIKT